MELTAISKTAIGNAMIGISYLSENDSSYIQQRLSSLDNDARYDGCFWEEALYNHNRMVIPARIIPGSNAVEVNTYRTILRELDEHSNHLQSDILQIAADAS